MAKAEFVWPEVCEMSPCDVHDLMRTRIYAECVYCGIVEYL